MTYHSGFVMSIRDSHGNILRESDGKVYLPFNSEYSLFLKNRNSVRASASVKIDGTDVLGGSAVIVGAYQELNLERFVLDGNLNNGKKFRFVPVTDEKVQDPTSSENGLVEVTFKQEQRIEYTMFNHGCSHTFDYDMPKTLGKSASIGSHSSGNVKGLYSCDITSTNCCVDSGATAGATVEGGQSKQSFTYSDFIPNLQAQDVVLRLRIVGRSEPLIAKDTKAIFCTSCGRKNVFKANYCCGCGAVITKFF